MTVTRSNGGKGVVVSHTDITERKQAETKLRGFPTMLIAAQEEESEEGLPPSSTTA